MYYCGCVRHVCGGSVGVKKEQENLSLRCDEKRRGKLGVRGCACWEVVSCFIYSTNPVCGTEHCVKGNREILKLICPVSVRVHRSTQSSSCSPWHAHTLLTYTQRHTHSIAFLSSVSNGTPGDPCDTNNSAQRGLLCDTVQPRTLDHVTAFQFVLKAVNAHPYCYHYPDKWVINLQGLLLVGELPWFVTITLCRVNSSHLSLMSGDRSESCGHNKPTTS